MGRAMHCCLSNTYQALDGRTEVSKQRMEREMRRGQRKDLGLARQQAAGSLPGPQALWAAEGVEAQFLP